MMYNYINQVCNPFYYLYVKKSIVSKRFVAAIDAIEQMPSDDAANIYTVVRMKEEESIVGVMT